MGVIFTDLHVIIVVISLMLALICKGELAACGLILLIASLASYVLYLIIEATTAPINTRSKITKRYTNAYSPKEGVKVTI